MRLSAFHECGNSLPSGSARWYDLGLLFEMTRYGPSHFGSIFPIFSAFGLRLRTQSPTEIFFLTTFLSLHLVVSFWYLFRLEAPCKMSSSIRSESSGGSLPSGVEVALRFWFFSSSRLMASAPYSNLNVVNLVVLVSEVLCDQTTFGSSSTHLPFF